MTSSGAGRGRGWLNLSKNADAPRPMGLSRPMVNAPPAPQVSPEYKELIDRIKELNVGDDGIKFNKKMQYIQSFWMQDCHNQEDVERSFEALYSACLYDKELATKLVSLMAARTFITQEIHECNLRQKFLKLLQRDFENSNQLQTNNPAMFHNSVHMLGEFYSKARLSNGEPFSFLAAPFLSCLQLLLASKTLPDLKLFTTQIYLNGAMLKSGEAEELTKLSLKVRSILVMEPQLIKEAKLWLLLAIDLFNAKFGVLSQDIYKFYEEQLGASVVASFQRPHDQLLSIQTVHTSKILDSYQSNVNVLQISTSPSESSETSQYPSSTEFNANFPKDLKNKEKTGRPILGVGARFIKKTNEDNGTWNNKQSATGRMHNSHNRIKSGKAWEHDDRFENDYN